MKWYEIMWLLVSTGAFVYCACVVYGLFEDRLLAVVEKNERALRGESDNER
jgi:hypothetical protein